MKLLLLQYLSSLKERGELDVVLPDILSEAGYNVISRPKRGTTQYGVDVVAIGPHPRTREKAVFLLSIKSGDLTRDEWATGKQALRPSLEEILEVYIPKHLPARLKGHPIIIALCFGGDMHEDVRARVDAFTDAKTVVGQIEFDEWNGDRIAEMMISGVLREKMFPKQMQKSFRKAVAFVDEPGICLQHFTELLCQLFATPPKNLIARLRLARQIYLATWTIFVWCRDAGNLEAAYQASVLATLWLWNLCSQHFSEAARGRELADVTEKMIALHRIIAASFLAVHVAEYAKVEDGLAASVPSGASIDINLKLFEVLGRVALNGLWAFHASAALAESDFVDVRAGIDADLQNSVVMIFDMINNNPVLQAPLRDDQAIEIMLVGILLARVGGIDFFASWIKSIMRTSIFSYRTNGEYPCTIGDYGELAQHPRQGDEYRNEVTAGSILYPTLGVWLAILGEEEAFKELSEFHRSDDMKHCTWQLWVPDETSEEMFYRDLDVHGAAITDLNFVGLETLIEQVNKEIVASSGFGKLSAARLGLWPIILTACRFYRLPVPIHFWAMESPTSP